MTGRVCMVFWITDNREYSWVLKHSRLLDGLSSALVTYEATLGKLSSYFFMLIFFWVGFYKLTFKCWICVTHIHENDINIRSIEWLQIEHIYVTINTHFFRVLASVAMKSLLLGLLVKFHFQCCSCWCIHPSTALFSDYLSDPQEDAQ